MLATAGTLPAGPGWAYELKWDGVRVLAEVSEGGLVLRSRSERDVTVTYPELAGLAAACPDMLLDGEVVAFADGRPAFTALQPRMHVRDARKAQALRASIPVTYLIFDVLRLYGVDLTDRPYAERRETLERLELQQVPCCAVPPAFDDGPATVAASRAQRLEGVVAKALDSRYVPGRRSPEWIKVRTVHRQELLVCGWQRGTGGRTDQIGSLVLGYYEAGRLRYAGQVGTGFTAAMLRLVRARLEPLRRKDSPFDEELPAADRKDVIWCEPEIVVMVEFGEWTPAGRLRFPSFQGIRDDKEPREVVRE